ncbi:uncharacterized protein LOC127725205 [Mytilus californianus]|uniref:uncharacterized protein LOC127725205 n=1 Tax=Mytilus californianus TaxID=6549 RepID=UPI002246C1C0|nr:uncharacterized protein LOC127725205 [Mytilus californianus]
MEFKISFYTLVIIILPAVLKVMHGAQPENPCPHTVDNKVADMCTDDSVVESSIYGGKTVDSVLLRITKQHNNCICHVSLQNTVTNYTIYMSKYEGFSNSAPEQQNCGLAVDVEYSDTSDITQSLQSIQCTIGTSMRSIALEGNELKLKSRIIAGDFTRGYCMQIYRNQAIITCKMNDQVQKAGSDGDWIETYGTQHTSVDECKQYCLQSKVCVAVHYEYSNQYCFVYNSTTKLFTRDDATYSQKHCVDTQKLKIRCYRPESTTQTDHVTTTEDTFTTKFETVTKPISDNHAKNSNTQSTIAREKENIKDTSTSFLVALVIAIIGCTVAVFFAGTTVFFNRQLHIQKRKIPITSSVNYVDLSGARDVSNYTAINTQAMSEQQYEIVNQRT